MQDFTVLLVVQAILAVDSLSLAFSQVVLWAVSY
jgi:hypothetical protein